MSATSHTPGPWRLDDDSDAVLNAAGFPVAELNFRGASGIDQVEANGYLLAAAPVLLNAAELALDALGTLGRFGPHAAAVHALREAIAAARGDIASIATHTPNTHTGA